MLIQKSFTVCIETWYEGRLKHTLDKRWKNSNLMILIQIQKLIQKGFTVCIETWYEAVQSARTLAVVSDFVKKDHHH